MKHFKRKIVTLGLALVLAAGASFTVFAGGIICVSSPDNTHHYNDHHMVEAGYTIPIGYHTYYAYEQDGQPVYKSDCMVSDVYKYCDYICIYCRMGLEGGTHTHRTGEHHSVGHVR